MDIPVCPAHQLATLWHPLCYLIVTTFFSVNDFLVRYGALVNPIWTSSYFVIAYSSSKTIFCLHSILVFLSDPRFVCQVLVPSYLCTVLLTELIVRMWLNGTASCTFFSLGHNNACLDKNDILLLYPHCFALLMDGTCQGMGTYSLKRVNEVTLINTPVSSHPLTLCWLCYFSVAYVRTII
jgi:hypothetical protein